MEQKSVNPFSWDKERYFKLFEILEKYEIRPYLTKDIENYLTIYNFFNFFINDQMVI